MDSKTTKTDGDRSLELREPTGHGDLDVDLRRAHGFGNELHYTMDCLLESCGEPLDEEIVLYAHRLARRLIQQLEHLDDDIRRALQAERKAALREDAREAVGLAE